MSRVSIGTVELTAAACTPDRDRAPGSPMPPFPGLGLTVGNKSDGLTGETLVPGIGGSSNSGGTRDCTSGGSAVDEDGSAELLRAATNSVADAENDNAPLAEAFAVKATCAAAGAEADTGSETSSS